MSVREALTGYYRNFGLRGVFTISAFRLFRRPVEITGRPPGIRHPVHLRVWTTDTSTYAEVLLRGEYAFDLPFSPRIILDAGANIGMASIYFTHRYPEARIIAVEAEASNFAVLERNVRPYPPSLRFTRPSGIATERSMSRSPILPPARAENGASSRARAPARKSAR